MPGRRRRVEDLRNHSLQGFVGPKAQDSPTRFGKCRVVASVSRDVRIQLTAPPIPVGFRVGPVLWAAVPEAAVYENRDTPPREHDVRLASQPSKGC